MAAFRKGVHSAALGAALAIKVKRYINKSAYGILNGMTRQNAAPDMIAGFTEPIRYPNGETVPTVAHKNEFGDGRLIPARPFFRPAIHNDQNEWRSEAITAAKNSIGGIDAFYDVMNAIGEAVVASVVEHIQEVETPPLSPTTIIKRREKRAEGQYVYSDTKPLMESLRMIGSVRHKVIQK